MASVFISYAHEDRDLATWVADCLRAGNVDVWRDQDRLISGQLTGEIVAALQSCEYTVFLMSRHWLRNSWCRMEADVVRKRDPKKLIVVELEPHKSLEEDMPHDLRRKELFGIRCDSGVDRVEAVGRIHCAVTQKQLRSRKKFIDLGRRLSSGFAPFVDSEDEPPADEVPEVLKCGRNDEFALVYERYKDRLHQLFLITGPRYEAHEYFVDRIQMTLERKPPYHAKKLEWPRGIRPGSEPEYRERLARAFDARSDLPGRLRELMMDKNLILIHPKIFEDYDDPAFVECFTQWLPNLLRETQPAQKLKCIQPIAWPVSRAMAIATLRWFDTKPDAVPEEVERLLDAIQKITDPTAERIPLTAISTDNVLNFCNLVRLSAEDRITLLLRLRDRNAETSDQILREIEKFMNGRKPQRAAG